MMPATLSCLVERRPRYTLVRLVGALDVPAAPQVRAALRKCLVEQPDGIVIDLSEVSACTPTALAVFRALAREAARWPVIPMLLCAPSPAVSAAVRPTSPPIHPSVEIAAAQLGHGPATPTLVDDLLPVVGAARRAREVVTEACVRWDLPHLVGPACIAVSELVNNAVEHAGTMITLRVSLRPRSLLVAVQDGSPRPPVLGGPGPRDATRGLRLVDAEAATWGHVATTDGKVVWATFRLTPFAD
jgi:anti-anti-sigma regulatory factor